MFEDTRRIARKPTRRQLAARERATRQPVAGQQASGPAASDWRASWAQRKAAFVDEAWKAMMQAGGAGRLYGYYTPSAGAQWGRLYVLTESAPVPEGAEPITAEAIPSGTRERIAAWLEPYAQRLPILPTEGPITGPARGAVLGSFTNRWRERQVTIYAHASDPGLVVTCGESTATPRAADVWTTEARTEYAQYIGRFGQVYA